MNVGFLLPILLAAAPAAKSAPIPDRFDADLQAGLPRGQVLAQKLAGDLDGDRKPEWVAVGEPKDASGQVSLAIFAPPKGAGKPTLRFAQWLKLDGATRAGAVIRDLPPVGPAVVLVAAAPAPSGDTVYTANVYALRGKDFRPLVPETLSFHGQGGFAIEDTDPRYPGVELVAWTYLTEDGEQLFDYHRYAWKTWHFDGVRWTDEVREKQTKDKFPNPAAAAKGIGLATGDARKSVPGISSLP
jgi:hypothetical protein